METEAVMSKWSPATRRDSLLAQAETGDISRPTESGREEAGVEVSGFVSGMAKDGPCLALPWEVG